ncbi:acetate kinase [Albidovulum inexpectatum]|uniref:Acetate kinase n=1 Tax=Albidovulum inexpectatum TaxID=196587 RepID=A0A2S5JEY3_9RHOB|nr:acetate/propionate family kinase [Albidovulum inexpectatum]PPB80067.1 acetate kinase [Albidovulum inexpectatum]
MSEHTILVINAGSSSIKAALFDAGLDVMMRASVTEIGGASRLEIGTEVGPCSAPTHQAALRQVLAALARNGYPLDRIRAAGHRVVHGGQNFTRPARVDPAVLAGIEACIPLAPLHNPHNLAAIRALGDLAPDLPQVAVFDTAFHATVPEIAARYAIPDGENARGIRRYGFHGISYASLVERLPDALDGRLPGRVLALHLGNGASICAIREGRSVATTMGYSPLSGLTMGTRAGDIDGNAVLRLAEIHGIEAAARILNRESGLVALGGASDMRVLHSRADAAARFAIEHFCYWAARHSGSMIVAMGGLDAIVFTGGIGENDAEARGRICAHLAWLGVEIDPARNERNEARIDSGGLPVLILPAAEEKHIAQQTRQVLGD